jgi:chaperonin GroES
MTTIRPVGDRIIAQKVVQEQKKGGLILPDSSQDQIIFEVVAVGPGKMTDQGSMIPQPVKVSDHILIEKYAGQEVTLDEEDYIILKADDVIAVLE